MRGATTHETEISTFAHRIACAACALLAACGGSSRGTPDASDPGAQTITVRLKSTANLALIAFRDGRTGAWQTPPATAPGRYELLVHGPYTVLDVCNPAGAAATLALSRTLDDPHDLDLSCLIGAPAPLLSHVTGSIGVFGSIQVGPRGALTQSDGQFDVQVPNGTYDVIARTLSTSSTQDRIAIRRNLVVAGDTMVTPAIDVAAEGTSTTFVEPTVTNLAAGEMLVMSGVLTTPTVSTSTSYPDTVRVLPDAALGPNDMQSIAIEAFTNTSTRTSQRSVTRRYAAGTSVVFTLPPVLAVQYTSSGGQPVATWSSLPPFDRLRFAIGEGDVNSAGLFVEQVTDLSPSYVAATGATSAAFDTDLPGYDSAWRTEVTRPWGRDAQATRTDGDDVMVSSYQENVTP